MCKCESLCVLNIMCVRAYRGVTGGVQGGDFLRFPKCPHPTAISRVWVSVPMGLKEGNGEQIIGVFSGECICVCVWVCVYQGMLHNARSSTRVRISLNLRYFNLFPDCIQKDFVKPENGFSRKGPTLKFS